MFDFSRLDEKTVIVGFLEKHQDSKMKNHILLIAKRCIYTCINSKSKPSIDVFKRMLFSSYTQEQYIAKRKGKLATHQRKWNCIVPLFTSIHS